MTRISRISSPRASLATVALLVIVLFGLGVLAQTGHDAAAVTTTATAPAPEHHSIIRTLLGLCYGG